MLQLQHFVCKRHSTVLDNERVGLKTERSTVGGPKCGTQMSSVVENEQADHEYLPSMDARPDLLTSGLRRISEPRAALAHSAIVHETIPMSRCSEPIRAAWERIRSSSSCYRSPFFSFDFIDAVSQVCPHVELAVARHEQRILAVLPFVRKRKQDASPVGAGVNDAHGLVAMLSIHFRSHSF